jgi:AhpD family alkylhydroperoxidase
VSAKTLSAPPMVEASGPGPGAPLPAIRMLDQPADAPATPVHHPIMADRKPHRTRALLRRWRDVKAIWGGGRLEPVFREELMISVAAANSCRQCSFAHREWAIAEGIPFERLAALEGMDADKFDDHTWAAIAWVQAAARSDFSTIPPATDANFRREYSSQEQKDIELVARTMYWMNEISNGVDNAMLRVSGKRAEGNIKSDVEAVLLYVTTVPFLFVYLGMKQGKRPMEVARGMRPYFQQFQVRGQP